MDGHPFGSIKRQVAAIGQGTWYIETAERRSAIAALRRGLDLGMTHIDTAEMYGSGQAEEVVAEAIAGRRDEVFLVSKVLPQNASRNGTVAACEQSLARLKTDRLDCYLLHWRGSHPLEETIAAFEQLQREGKILSWGVSNFDVADLEEVAEHRRRRPHRLQPGALPSERARHRARRDSLVRGAWRRRRWPTARSVTVTFLARKRAAGRVLKEIAAAHDATPRQVALRFLIRRPSLFAIPKASSPAHAAENAGAGDLMLTAREIDLIDEAFALDRHRRRLPMG